MTNKDDKSKQGTDLAGRNEMVVMPDQPLEGDLIRPSEWREQDDRYGVGDYVTRDGTDVHKVLSLNIDGGDLGEFVCVVAPEPSHDGTRWAEVGEVDSNLTRRYSPIDYEEA